MNESIYNQPLLAFLTVNLILKQPTGHLVSAVTIVISKYSLARKVAIDVEASGTFKIID